MNGFTNALVTLSMALCLGQPGSALAQDLVKQVVAKHRSSIVYLTVSKTSDTGAVTEVAGTGFIISDRGHVLTNCHVVDKVLRDETGNPLPTAVDKVSVSGATGSKAGFAEPLSFLNCATDGIDLALLKFKNTALPRSPVKVVADQPSVGDELAAIGFPLGTEFFARPGTLSSEADNDTLLVSMVLNTGDSGAPIFDKKVHVVAVAEAGFGDGTGIGVARPIRHAALLLAIAGVNLFAIDAPIASVPAPGQPKDSNLFLVANGLAASLAFSKGATTTASPGATKLTVTYPLFKELSGLQAFKSGVIDVKSIAAKPGYKVVEAKFLLTESQGVDVLHVGAAPDGSAARAAFERSTTASAMNGTTPFVKGYVETTQVKIK